MATNETNSVIVELYDLPLTNRKDDRFGRVVTSKSLSEDDLIAMAVSRRTDLSPTTIRASMDIMQELALEQIVNGASVSFGLGYFNLSVNGVFVGDSAHWDSSEHHLSIQITPTAHLRNAVKDCKVKVRGRATFGSVINTVTDVISGEVNTRLTPGGGVNMAGTKIRIVGDKKVGITLTNQATAEMITIPASSILVNNPKNITFITPPSIIDGDYKLSITTQYSNSSTSLKEPRTFIFEYILNVSA